MEEEKERSLLYFTLFEARISILSRIEVSPRLVKEKKRWMKGRKKVNERYTIYDIFMRGRERRGRVSSKKKKKAVITGRHKIRMEKGAWNGRRERGTRRVTRRVTRHSERRARGTMAPIGIDYLNYLLTPPPAVNRESGWTDTCSSRGGGGGGSGNTGPRDARASLFHGERERERSRPFIPRPVYIRYLSLPLFKLPSARGGQLDSIVEKTSSFHCPGRMGTGAASTPID